MGVAGGMLVALACEVVRDTGVSESRMGSRSLGGADLESGGKRSPPRPVNDGRPLETSDAGDPSSRGVLPLLGREVVRDICIGVGLQERNGSGRFDFHARFSSIQRDRRAADRCGWMREIGSRESRAEERQSELELSHGARAADSGEALDRVVAVHGNWSDLERAERR